jgi:hypothetical protein
MEMYLLEYNVPVCRTWFTVKNNKSGVSILCCLLVLQQLCLLKYKVSGLISMALVSGQFYSIFTYVCASYPKYMYIHTHQKVNACRYIIVIMICLDNQIFHYYALLRLGYLQKSDIFIEHVSYMKSTIFWDVL